MTHNNTYKNHLLTAFETHQATIAIIGLGYVGLPLGVEFAKAGFHVIGIDTNVAKVEQINQGISYVGDVTSEELKPLVQQGLFEATTDYSRIIEAHSISICVPTPLRKTKDPDMTYVLQSVESIIEYCQPGKLIVLESTTYPGTTEELIADKLRNRGFTIGEDIFVAFSPERIDPGNKHYTVHNTPKVVGGISPHCTELSCLLYGTIIAEIIPVSNPTVAEMVKLLENTFRAVNIGLVNEMALICDRLNINVWEVIQAAASKPFGFMPFYPGPGLGGHCIPVDPHYLSWKLKTMNYTARFIELASEINTAMPIYVVNKIADALNDDAKSLRGSQILILGVAYKPNIDDVRESPALDILGLLHEKGAQVRYHDPYVPKVWVQDDLQFTNTPYSAALLKEADAVVIVTNHSGFDYQEIVNLAKVVVDTRNATAGLKPLARIVSI
jgi:UDP-N-acetyl-D-glucosamine dehydrogenase